MRIWCILLFGAAAVVMGIALLKPTATLFLGAGAFIFVGCILIFVAGMEAGTANSESDRSHDPTA